MANSFSYGGTDLSGSTYGLTVTALSTHSAMADPKTAKWALGGADGKRVSAPRLSSMIMNMECIISGTSRTNLMQRMDAVCALLDARNGEKLLIVDDETTIDAAVNRGYYAILIGPVYLITETATYYKIQLNWEIPSGKAVTAATTTQTVTETAGAISFNMPASGAIVGNDYARPVWTLTAGGTISAIVLTNSTTSETLHWTGALSATHKLRIDSDRYAIEKSEDGGTTYTSVISGLTVGDPFPRLRCGVANAIVITRTAADALLAASITYRGVFL